MLWLLATAEQARAVGLPNQDFWGSVYARTRELAAAVMPLIEQYSRGRRRRPLLRRMVSAWNLRTPGPVVENVRNLGSRMPWWVR